MRFGVIGTNFISQEFVQAGQTLDGFVLRAVYSRGLETAAAFAECFGGAECLTTLDDLAEHPEIDAVYIASPNALHAPQAERMLRAGKHVFLEKPACPNAETFRRLVDLANEMGVAFVEAMRPAYTPGYSALCEAVKEIGAVRHVSFSYCQYSSRYDKFKKGIVENAFDPSLCNGALMDIGVYCAHMLVALFGTPNSILAMAQRLHNGLDAQGAVICGFDGMLADLTFSKIADGKRQNEIQGESGTLLIDSVSNPKHIERIARDGSRASVYYDPDPEFFGMAHEIRAFQRFAEDAMQGKRDEMTRRNSVTEKTLFMMDEIRRQTGIDFVRRDTGIGGTGT